MKNIGLYIHIPFCESKCPYCDFYSINNKDEYDNYVFHLCDRIKYFGEKYKRTVDTIYFGGGTPSAIGTNNLLNILSTIFESFQVTENAEITVELNPCSAQRLDFSKMLSAGFNRLSIGMQSANNDELKTLGRRHNTDDVKAVIKSARKAGFKNISLDLMLCIPNQTKNSLSRSIKFCSECGVEHISAYILKFEENTMFYKRKAEYDTFDEESQSQMYLEAVNELKNYGYHQYEISNFCKPSYESKHNLHYWRDEEYIGIGPSAHSFIDNKRFYYDRDINAFYKNILIDDGAGGDIYEYIMLKLRLSEGLNLNILCDKFGYKVSSDLLKKVNNLSCEKLITYKDNTITLTTKGYLVSNSIISYLTDSI